MVGTRSKDKADHDAPASIASSRPKRTITKTEKAKIQEEMSASTKKGRKACRRKKKATTIKTTTPPAPSTRIDTISESAPKDSIKSPRPLKGQAGQISTTRHPPRKRLYLEQTEGKEKSLEEKEDGANSLISLSLSKERPQWQLPKNKSQSPSQGKIDASSSSSPSKSKTDISPASSRISYPTSSPPSFQESPSSDKENNRPRSPSSNSLDKQKSTMSLQPTNIKEGTVLTICPSSSQLKNTESTSNHVEEAASAATKKRKEEAAAVKKSKEEEDTAASAEKSKEEDEAAASTKKRKEEEEAAASAKKRKEEEEAAASAEKSKEEDEAAASTKKSKEEEEAAASTKKRKEEEEAAVAAAKKKEERAASAKERTKSPSSTNPGTRGWGVKLPQHMEGIPLHCYSEIDAGMESEYLNFLRHGKEITEAKFCFDDITIIDRDYLILSISTLCNDDRLWAGYSILDLATIWTFLNQGGNMQWCALPARFFESMRTGSYGKKESGLVNRVLNMTHHSTDLFLFDVITFPVWFEDHFSVVFILYAGNVVKGLYGNMIDEKDPHPCIIYANSIPGMKSRFHNKDKVAEGIRTFLNKYGEENMRNWRRCFNKNSFPVYELKVPAQSTSWDCGFQTLVIRHKFMKALDDLSIITIDHLEEESIELFTRTYFSYNALEESSAVREDLAYLTRCLKKIRQYQRDKSVTLDFNRTEIDQDTIVIEDNPDADTTGVEPHVRKLKTKRSAPTKEKGKSKKKTRSMRIEAKEERKRKEEADDERLLKFDGKLSNTEGEITQEEEEEVQGSLRRNAGERAVMLESYKDQVHRRVLYQNVKYATLYQNMLPYQSEIANRTNETSTAMSLITDRVGRYPDKRGTGYEPARESPCRLAIAPSQEYFDAYVDDLIKNRKKYIVTQDFVKVDLDIMGKRKMSLNNFLKSHKKRKEAALMKENRKALSNPKKMKSSPTNKDRLQSTAPTDYEHTDMF